MFLGLRWGLFCQVCVFVLGDDGFKTGVADESQTFSSSASGIHRHPGSLPFPGHLHDRPHSHHVSYQDHHHNLRLHPCHPCLGPCTRRVLGLHGLHRIHRHDHHHSRPLLRILRDGHRHNHLVPCLLLHQIHLCLDPCIRRARDLLLLGFQLPLVEQCPP